MQAAHHASYVLKLHVCACAGVGAMPSDGGQAGG